VLSLVAAAALTVAASAYATTALRDSPPRAITSRTLVEARDPVGAPGRTLRMYRVRLAPGAVIPPHHHPGTQASLVTRGTLTYWVMTGSVTVRRGDPDAAGGARVVRRVKAGQKVRISAGEWIVEQPTEFHHAANHSDGPVEIQISALFRSGEPLSIPLKRPAS
jgi:quercetin dioxygenase-like cupin family protein